MEAQPCYCDTDKCSGYIGGAKSSEMSVVEGYHEEADGTFTFDDEDSVNEVVNKRPGAGLESVEQVQALIKYLMYASSDIKKVLSKLNKILVIFNY